MYASAVCSGKVTPGGKKNRKKAMGGGMMDKRMGLRFGGPKPLETKMDEKKADQTKNVKKLMTQSDAYDPETRFIKGTKKTAGGSTNFTRRTTDQVDLREAVKKAKEDNPGFRVTVMKPEDMPLRKNKRRPVSKLQKKTKFVEPSRPSRKPEEKKPTQNLSRGGRVGLKAGSKGCKLAMRGKGRAYGKNS